jgi:hypothetical protein
VASPQAHLRNNPVNAKPCLELAGTGSGAVRIAGFKLGKNVPSVWGFSSEPAIVGQGFDELDIVRCIVGPGVMSHVNASGDSAVSVSIPLVVVSNSELTGQANNNWNGMAIKNFPTLVVDGTAIVLDSSVKGADAVGLDYLVTVWWGPIPNCPCPDLFGDKNSGGDGIHATKAFHVNSEIAGGKGGAVTIQLAGAGKQPDGLPFGASTEVVALPDAGISTSAALAIGSSWTLDSTWTAELYGALGVTTPWEVLGPGSGSWAFIKPRHIAHLTPAGLTVAWPGDASWIGTPLAMQAYDPVLGLSRPVFDIFMP